MRKCKIAHKPVSSPVEVRFKWNDGLDVDNHAALGKAIVDARKSEKSKYKKVWIS